MGRIALWSVVGVVGFVLLVVVVRWLALWLDRFLLRAEERGWIYYRNKSGGGTISGGIAGAMTELGKIVQPSVEHRIEVEDHVVEKDEKGGE